MLGAGSPFCFLHCCAECNSVRKYCLQFTFVCSQPFRIMQSPLILSSGLFKLATYLQNIFTYFLFSGSHLSFPLHLASRNARKFSCHSSWPADGNWVSLSSLYRRNDLQSSDAFISSPLCHNLYFRPLRIGADLRFSGICCCCSNWVGMCCDLQKNKISQ